VAHASEKKRLEIEGCTLRELVVQGNGKDAELRAVAADGRRFIYDFYGSHLKIRVRGAVLTEIKLRVRYTADRLLLRIARTTTLEDDEDSDADEIGFHIGPPISGVIYDGTLTLVGERHVDSVATDHLKGKQGGKEERRTKKARGGADRA
jgi:hypothetical protein